MLARIFEVANVCFSIMMTPAPRIAVVRVAREPEPVDDYSSALARFHRAYPQL